jgi:hypothetical protein
MLITPLMMLNNVLFSIGASIVGVNVKQLSSLSTFVKTQAITMKGFTGPSFAVEAMLSRVANVQRSAITALQSVRREAKSVEQAVVKATRTAFPGGTRPLFQKNNVLIPKLASSVKLPVLISEFKLDPKGVKLPTLAETFKVFSNVQQGRQLQFALFDSVAPAKQLAFAFEDVASTYKQLTFALDIQPDLPFGDSNTGIIKSTTQFKSLGEVLQDLTGYAKTLYNSPVFAEGLDDDARRAKAVANSLEVKNVPASLGKNLRRMLDAALSSSSFKTRRLSL